MFRDHIIFNIFLRQDIMKYRFTPKVCGAQHVSIDGGPHATHLKIRNHTKKLFHKMWSIP